MANNRSNQKSEAGLRNSAISLTLGISSIIFAIILPRLIWMLLLVAAAPVALIGLFFGGIGLNSTGKWRPLAVIAVVVCFLALVVSIYMRIGVEAADIFLY